ncbi:MAG: hypothetical protein CO093_08580 [Alphaproteobacteria bacterium CG_4_9_14_3_um_filter_47_13]|nr:MAG: hypothetical protein CO093_08580 [Alphaproteobacteria bacterium CG_4_9_14_3_um_filter_47_13]
MTAQTQNDQNRGPDFYAKTKEGHGKTVNFEQVGVAWEREDGSIYFKPYGKQVIEGPIYLFKAEKKPAAEA